MYETFYGFSQPPFGLTPDIRFCYQHRSYTRAKAYMEYAVMRGEGFLVVTGRPGMGKTTLIQDLLGDLGNGQRLVARIDSTQLDADDLLRFVTYAFGLPAKGLDKATLLHNLGDFLRRRPAGAGTAILIVDEAQNLPDRSLEELRLITNLQQGSNALIQIFLIGQESLRDVIRQRNLEQLQQRVVAACHLEPLDLQETRAYVRHRLRCAGWSGDPTFEAEALGLIYQASSGVPRVINKVCDRLLLYGSVDELHSIRGPDARMVIQEFQGEFLETAEMDALGGEPPRREGSQGSEIEDLCWDPEDEDQTLSQGVRGGAGGEGPIAGAQELPGGPLGAAIGFSSASDTLAEGAMGPAVDPEHPWVAPGPGRLGGDAVGHPHPGLVSEAEPVGRPAAGLDPVGAVSLPMGAGPVTSSAGGGPRPVRRRRPRYWPFAAVAGLLLGLGGLAWAIHGRTPDGVFAQVTRWTDVALSGIRTLSSDLGASRRAAVQDPGQVVEGRVVAFSAETGAEQDPIDPDDATFDGTTPDLGVGPITPGTAYQVDVWPAPSVPIGFLSHSGPGMDPDPPPTDQQVPEGVMDGSVSLESFPNETAPVESERDIPPEPAPSPRSDAVDSDRLGAPGGAPGAPSPRGEPLEALVADAGSIESLTVSMTQPAEPPPPDEAAEEVPPGRQADSLPDSGQAAQTPAAEPPQAPAALVAAGSAQGPGQMPLSALKEDLRGLGLRARDQGEGVLTFDLAEEVPFDFGSARLPDQAQVVLAPLAQALIRNPGLKVTLVGHTDDAGPADYNRRLSLARARAVEAYLKQLGVPDSRLASRGLGKDALFPEESNPAAARHRRVEVVIRPAAP